jgi:uncharacterized protein YjiS (DUF1127 family)
VLHLPADGAVRDVQLVGGLRHPSVPSRRLESAKSIQGWKTAHHVRFPNIACSIISLFSGHAMVCRCSMNGGKDHQWNIDRPLLLVACLLATWIARCSQRKALAELEPFRLDDIGIGSAERDRECCKRFWE